MASLLNHTSADDLKSTLRCARSNGRPFAIERLQASLDDERNGNAPRKSIIALLEAEIRRQEKQA